MFQHVSIYKEYVTKYVVINSIDFSYTNDFDYTPPYQGKKIISFWDDYCVEEFRFSSQKGWQILTNREWASSIASAKISSIC
jgi:hypothetical protein